MRPTNSNYLLQYCITPWEPPFTISTIYTLHDMVAHIIGISTIPIQSTSPVFIFQPVFIQHIRVHCYFLHLLAKTRLHLIYLLTSKSCAIHEMICRIEKICWQSYRSHKRIIKLVGVLVHCYTIPCPRLGVEWIERISWLPRAHLGPIFMTSLPER